MQFVIFHSPKRKAELDLLLAELHGLDVAVIDDVDTFGKERFWMRMRKAIAICEMSVHNDFCIMPDDVSMVDLNNIMWLAYLLQDRLYTINLINDGRSGCWGSNPVSDLHTELMGIRLHHVDFCDCGFITNRKTLEQIEIKPIKKSWFKSPDRSSGVGKQLSQQLRGIGAVMWTPEHSLCYHGDHESIMHPEHRKKTPLKSL